MLQFGEKVLEGRKIVIPFDHGRHIPQPPASFRVKRPDVAGHGLIVRVDLMGSMIRMSREMDLDYPVRGTASMNFSGSKSWLKEETKTLFTSNKSQQSARSQSSRANAHSSISDSAKVT